MAWPKKQYALKGSYVAINCISNFPTRWVADDNDDAHIIQDRVQLQSNFIVVRVNFTDSTTLSCYQKTFLRETLVGKSTIIVQGGTYRHNP